MTHDQTGSVRLRPFQAYTYVLRTALSGGEADITEAVEALTVRELARLMNAMDQIRLTAERRRARLRRLS